MEPRNDPPPVPDLHAIHRYLDVVEAALVEQDKIDKEATDKLAKLEFQLEILEDVLKRYLKMLWDGKLDMKFSVDVEWEWDKVKQNYLHDRGGFRTKFTVFDYLPAAVKHTDAYVEELLRFIQRVEGRLKQLDG